MYLMPIHVPIYVSGDRRMLSSEWSRSLELLRDSLEGRFGPICVAAPSLPADDALADQVLVRPPEGITLSNGFDLRCRAREYWVRHRPGWRRQLMELVDKADVVHGGLDDVYRPIGFEGFRAAIQLNKPTLFFQDTDIVVQQRQLAAGEGSMRRVKAQAYATIYERLCRWSVAHADLSLLKGSMLIKRYGSFAKHAVEFHDTSFSEQDIVDTDSLQRRLSSLGTRAVRFVYCGRLVQRKGLEASLRLIGQLVQRGVPVEFDIIGNGPEREALEKLCADIGATAQVRFLGALPYGGELLRKLSEYDALLFTPAVEDTPRMIFDSYAAGLPLVAFDIDYVRERAEQDRTTVLLPRNDPAKSAELLEALCRQPAPLAALSLRAREAAVEHSSESWYRRRAQWTFEAVERHHAQTNPGSRAGAMAA